MDFWSFILTIIAIGLLCLVIYLLKWLYRNVEFSENKKIQHFVEIGLKAVIIFFYCILAYTVLEAIFILIAPLTEKIGSAFSIALDKILSFLAKLVPFAVLVAITRYYLKNRQNKGDDGGNGGGGGGEVDVELIRQRAREQYEDVRAVMFHAIQGAATITPLMRPYDEFAIEIATAGDHFYLDGPDPVFQFENDLEVAIDKAQNDSIQRETQRFAAKNITRYPQLISEEAKGRSPIEILDVKNLGGRVCFDVVLTTTSTIPKIDARRRARVERQQRQQTISDPDYCE